MTKNLIIFSVLFLDDFEKFFRVEFIHFVIISAFMRK